mgnify:CR=1 FL=1
MTESTQKILVVDDELNLLCHRNVGLHTSLCIEMAHHKSAITSMIVISIANAGTSSARQLECNATSSTRQPE